MKKWHEHAAGFAPLHASRLMWLQAYPAYHRGRYIESRSYVIEAQRIFDQLGDANLELKANLLNDLAYTSSALGDVELVLANHMQALQIRRDLFGKQHTDIATSLTNVGHWYGEQGDLQRALEYSEQALAMRRELFGNQHPAIATPLNNVGQWYGKRGDLQRALEYSEQALAMQRELFGEQHPAIATSLNNVGHWYGE